MHTAAVHVVAARKRRNTASAVDPPPAPDPQAPVRFPSKPQRDEVRDLGRFECSTAPRCSETQLEGLEAE
jgi:hypothetical protein